MRTKVATKFQNIDFFFFNFRKVYTSENIFAKYYAGISKNNDSIVVLYIQGSSFASGFKDVTAT